MARIRSVHPGQWTDEDFVSCTFPARLLAIALRNMADDHGVFEWKPVQIKMQAIPADTIEVGPLLDELVENNQVRRFESAGKQYGVIRNFRRWQRPEKPKPVHHLPDNLRLYVGLTPSDTSPIADHSPTDAVPGGHGSPNEVDTEHSKSPNGHDPGGGQSTTSRRPITDRLPNCDSEEGGRRKMEEGKERKKAAGANARTLDPPPQPVGRDAMTRPVQHRQPVVGDPPDAWAHLADRLPNGSPKVQGAEPTVIGERVFPVDPADVGRPIVGDAYLDKAAEALCEAAEINTASWRGDWRPLIAWLRDGLEFDGHILPTIRRVASRPGYQPPRSLAYFDDVVRQRSKVPA